MLRLPQTRPTTNHQLPNIRPHRVPPTPELDAMLPRPRTLDATTDASRAELSALGTAQSGCLVGRTGAGRADKRSREQNDTAARAGGAAALVCGWQQKDMSAVGFEPTRSKTLRPEPKPNATTNKRHAINAQTHATTHIPTRHTTHRLHTSYTHRRVATGPHRPDHPVRHTNALLSSLLAASKSHRSALTALWTGLGYAINPRNTLRLPQTRPTTNHQLPNIRPHRVPPTPELDAMLPRPRTLDATTDASRAELSALGTAQSGCLVGRRGAGRADKRSREQNDTAARAGGAAALVCGWQQKDMSAVGFEPTRSKTLRPERNPLDHSGKLTG
ncbi:hypothetical protein ON010_g16732 [Phytophthora cinnamomi]|nr:hypothetical protein ON010_g16732 [Phytophthora cinnamomi]